MKRIRIVVLLILGCMLAAAYPALAGGWGVATLDELPGAVRAGEPFTIAFTVRQHGVHPVEFEVTPALNFRHAASRQTVTVFAERSGAVGHFAATVTLPEPGEWAWTLDAFGWGGPVQPMPEVSVLEGAASAPAVIPAQTASALAGVVSLAAAAFGLLLLVWTRRPWAAGLLIGATLAAVLSFALPGASAARSSAAAGAADALSPTAETGRALFLAKGCVTCHDHPSVSALRRETLGEFNSFSTGPDLAERKLSAEYLRLWLKDPASLKPETLMPQLDLSADEIEALAALLAPSP